MAINYALSHINREATLIAISCGRFYASLWTRLLKKSVRSFKKVETIFRVCVQSNIIILWRELSWILYVTRQTQMSFLEVCTYIPRSFWTRLDKKREHKLHFTLRKLRPFSRLLQICTQFENGLKPCISKERPKWPDKKHLSIGKFIQLSLLLGLSLRSMAPLI